MSEARESLFPDGCTCGHYGRGLTMTRVHMETCPVHGRAVKPREYKVCCIKYGPPADFRNDEKWCLCSSPIMKNCARDQATAV